MNTWKRISRKVKAPQLLVGLLLTLSFLTGCSAQTPNQNPYMLTGAGLGAATGAAIGIAASPNNPWKGAAIGGLLGTALGGVGGEMYGRTVNPPPYYQPPQPNYGPPPAAYAPAPQPQGYSYAPAPPGYN
jgi:osmotically inducible lipoprotein OsmB